MNLLRIFQSKAPADCLIRQTARKQWKLLLVNIVSSLLEAFTEGATLAIIFLAVEHLHALLFHDQLPVTGGVG